MYHRVVVGTLALLFFTVSPVVAEELVVLESAGSSMQPGQVLDGSKPLKLAAQEKLTLIAADGRMFHVQGPSEQIPIGAGQKKKKSMKEVVAHLMSTPGKDTGSFGVMRSADDVFKMAGKKLPNPWLVDITQSGSQCHQQGRLPVFWRVDKAKNVTVTIHMDEEKWVAAWPAGKSKMQFPPTMPLVDGKTYEIEVDNSKTDMTLHLMPKTVKAKPAQAAWMKHKKCQNQFMVMVRSLANAPETAYP